MIVLTVAHRSAGETEFRGWIAEATAGRCLDRDRLISGGMGANAQRIIMLPKTARQPCAAREIQKLKRAPRGTV